MGNISDYCCDIQSENTNLNNNNVRPNSQNNLNRNIAPTSIPSSVHWKKFQPVKLLCESVYGKITTVKLTESNNDKLFAMKIIDKSKIKEESLLQSSYLQTGILTDDNPFVAKILHVSQNNLNIYIVMEYVPGLDLYYYLYQEAKKDKLFSEQTVKQIVAQAILGLQFLHSKKIIYRQLKPENLLCTEEGHIKLTDYALSKIQKVNQPAMTYLSTIQYMAPEMLDRNIGYNQNADIWSLGILLYELKFGYTPFRGQDQRIMIQNIRQGNIEFPERSQYCQYSQDFKKLIQQLTRNVPQERPKLQQIKKHSFFNDIDWEQVSQRRNETGLKQIMKQYNLNQKGKDDNPPLRAYMKQQSREHIKTPYCQFTHPTDESLRIQGN